MHATLSSIFLILIANVTVYALDQENELIRKKRIINGEEANAKNYPWVVSMQGRHGSRLTSFFTRKDSKSVCGGTMIGKQWVLTAAHCFFRTIDKRKGLKQRIPNTNWHLRFADSLLKPKTLDKFTGFFVYLMNKMFGTERKQNYYHISKVIIHPDYQPGVLESDIAIVKVKEDIDFKKIIGAEELRLPIMLNKLRWPNAGQTCQVIGWGCNRVYGPPVLKLTKLNVPILSGRKCRDIYQADINLTDTKEFCAGYADGNAGICPGDSGGPIMCKHTDGNEYLAGIVSATHADEPESYPGLFTRMTHFYDWVKREIEKNS